MAKIWYGLLGTIYDPQGPFRNCIPTCPKAYAYLISKSIYNIKAEVRDKHDEMLLY